MIQFLQILQSLLRKERSRRIFRSFLGNVLFSEIIFISLNFLANFPAPVYLPPCGSFPAIKFATRNFRSMN